MIGRMLGRRPFGGVTFPCSGCGQQLVSVPGHQYEEHKGPCGPDCLPAYDKEACRLCPYPACSADNFERIREALHQPVVVSP